jgi:hypothetical protein
MKGGYEYRNQVGYFALAEKKGPVRHQDTVLIKTGDFIVSQKRPSRFIETAFLF